MKAHICTLINIQAHTHPIQADEHMHTADRFLCLAHRGVSVLRYGRAQMALSRLSPRLISQNTPVTAGTCVARLHRRHRD